MKKVLLSVLFSSAMFASEMISGDVGYQFFKKNQIDRAIKILTINSKEGDVTSIYLLGIIYGQMREYDNSIKYLTRAAWLGNTSAQSKLALIYHYGIGIAKNNAKAFYWLKKAAKENLTSAQYILGRMYIYGDKPVEKNLVKAAFWLNKAKDKNYKDSRYIWNSYNLQKYL